MSILCKTETPSGMRQVITFDAHTLHADVAEALGGANSAPGPHDYFDVSLAACKALTATVYARARKIPLERVIVEVTRDDSRERQGTYALSVKLDFEGPSPEEKAKIHDALTRCPIHKLMTTTTIEITQLPLEAG